MKTYEREHVNITIDNEGFEYCFDSYSNFYEIEDEDFHKLRLAYLKSIKNLKKYLKREE